MKADDAKKIISTAIDREVEAYTFYRSIADKVKDKALKDLFAELAGEEKQHREFLQGMLTKDIAKMKFDPSHDYKMADMLPSPPLSIDMKPIDGIVVAIKKELEAMQMYTQLANLAKDTETQLLFSQLANMERGHKARLEDLYTEMAFPEVW
jgi:rubrerythrin